MTIRNGKPDGCTTLTPLLVCSPAAEALSFYEAVFGARLVSRLDAPDGTVAHAELDFGEGGCRPGTRARCLRWLRRRPLHVSRDAPTRR